MRWVPEFWFGRRIGKGDIITIPFRSFIGFTQGNRVPSSSLRPGSLVLYKIHPAIVAAVADKIEIQLAGGKAKRVRDKDVTLLHPGPLTSLGALDPGEAAVDEAWELLEGEQVALPELAEFLYGDYSPAAAWGAWQLLQDGLYFEGDPDNIRRRSEQAVSNERAARAEKQQAEQAWADFLERVQAGELEDDDRKRLAEVERVALGSAATSRILASLDVQQTPDAAHRFLVRCGYWPADFNPWPARANAQLQPVEIGVPELADEPRRDLTGLEAWAIDDAGNEDPDDAISIDGDRLWVHVADVAALVRPGGHMDRAARERGANLYLPEGIHTMLPATVTHQLGLGLAAQSPALSFGFRFDGERVTDIEVTPSWVRVRRATYDEIDQRMHELPFAAIRQVTDAYRQRRLQRGAARIDLPEVSVRLLNGEVVIRPLPKLDSRDMVTDAMLMAGEAAARFAETENVAIPFVMQPTPDEVRQPQGMAEMYAYRRLFKPSRVGLSAEAHFGLGLDVYARATSPLRRYSDLLVHQQLRAHVLGRSVLSRDEVLERTASLDASGAVIRRAERLSNLHWKLVYLQRKPDWQGDAVVVALEERKSVVMIPELALETRIRASGEHRLDEQLRLELREVDVPGQNAWFGVSG
ncbi:MAG: RNB domain-containing ribonuclease [Gammaproteobacteria bacterium]|nr:RNB domain-containing ribonuclease [Gammaproteobacteria bacterium]